MKTLVAGLCLGFIGCLSAQRVHAQKVIFFDSASSAARSQPLPVNRPASTIKKPLLKKPKPLRSELSIGARLNSNGWGVYADKGWVRNNGERESDLFYNLRMATLEIDEVKHPKETKQTNTTLGSFANEKPRPYIYGKINNFYTVKLGYGFRRMIAGKPEQGNVSVHWFGSGGLALGLLKPYYINAFVAQDNIGTYTKQTIKYEDSTKGAFLQDYFIIGAAGFSKGLNEIKIIPGIHLKTGLHFDFAPSKRTVLAIEVGANAEYYSKKIELMANQDAYPYNINIFASLQFGKRW